MMKLSMPLKVGWTARGAINLPCVCPLCLTQTRIEGVTRMCPDIDASAQVSRESCQTMQAVVVPSGDGLVTIRPAIVAAPAPPRDVQDAEVELNADELLALEAMSNLHEYAYEEWTTNVPFGRIGELRDGKCVGEGPSMELVVARTFLVVTNGTRPSRTSA
jgi:hypothetical protein